MAKRKTRQPVQWEAVTPATGTVVPETAAAQPGRFKVRLDFLPEMVVEAASEDDAVQAYNSMLGVIRTQNRYAIERLPESVS